MVDPFSILFKATDARFAIDVDYAKLYEIIGHMGSPPLSPDISVDDFIDKEPASHHRIVGAGLDYSNKEVRDIVTINVSRLKLIYRPRQKGRTGIDDFIIIGR
jgi:hypothetical protein